MSKKNWVAEYFSIVGTWCNAVSGEVKFSERSEAIEWAKKMSLKPQNELVKVYYYSTPFNPKYIYFINGQEYTFKDNK